MTHDRATRILATSPIAYLPLWEECGSVAYDLTGNGCDGAYIGAGRGEYGGAFFDGIDDYINVTTPQFLSLFDGTEGTIAIRLRVANDGVWTDSKERRFLAIEAPGNYLLLRKLTQQNALNCQYNAGGVIKSVNIPTNSVERLWLTFTWSESEDLVIGYLNGEQVGVIGTSMGHWSAPPTMAIVGAGHATPNRVWWGSLSDAVFWNRPLPADEIAALWSVQ